LTSIDLKFIDEEKASEESGEESKEGNMVNMPKIISKGLIPPLDVVVRFPLSLLERSI
jgi:hypothetical protein